jgi:predicted ester cyclase
MAQMNNVSELNKLKIQLFIEAVLNQGRLELIDELIATDFVGHLPGAEPHVTGPAGVCQLVLSHRHAHRGLHFTIEDQISEEDRVATRWHATVPAPQAQDPLAPAGRTAHYAGISITRLLAGKQVDSHTECTSLAPNPARRQRPDGMAQFITRNHTCHPATHPRAAPTALDNRKESRDGSDVLSSHARPQTTGPADAAPAPPRL